jgi:hypothetical protein
MPTRHTKGRTGRLKAIKLPLLINRRTQLALLELPDLRDHLLAERREMQIEMARVLMANGLSMNGAARVLGFSPSTLHLLLARYQRGGFAALVRKPFGRKSSQRGHVRPAWLHLQLTRLR